MIFGVSETECNMPVGLAECSARLLKHRGIGKPSGLRYVNYAPAKLARDIFCPELVEGLDYL